MAVPRRTLVPMQWRVRRALGVVVVGVAPAALLVGCGDDSAGPRSTLAPIQPSSYVVRDPVTTTTAPEVPDDGLDDDGRSSVEQEYTVQAGDAVSLIAARHGISAEDLAAYNEWPNGIQQAIFPGDVIRIPPGAMVPGAEQQQDTGQGDTATPATGTAPQTTLAGADGECVPGTYTLEAGDIPGRVANRFDVTLEQLNAANANTPGYASFIVGTVIQIPC